MNEIYINQTNNKKLLEFYKNLFKGTNASYGMFLYPHTFSPLQYKEIILPYPFIKIIDTNPMKTSNGKIQTASSYKSHPRMDVTRLDHMIFAQSIGVDLLVILEEKGYEIDNKTKIAFLVFLLTHDIGHGPFSHPFEQMVNGYKGMHEDIGKRAIKETKELTDVLESIFPGLTDIVTNFSEYDKYGLTALLEGIFDLDRAAFLIMDTYLMDGKDKETAYQEVVSSIYRIFESIILKEGKVYYDIKCFKDIDDFIRVRKENYQTVYQEPHRVLGDLILKRIGERLQSYKSTDSYQQKISKLPPNISKEITSFITFIDEMKVKKANIDLSEYYNFVDNDFNRIFNLLLLLNDPELNRDCLIMLSPVEAYDRYYQMERNVPKTGKEDFYVTNKFTIYKSTPEENITFIREDGTQIDYKDCEGKFTEDTTFSETLAFTFRYLPKLEYEEDIRQLLIEQLNDLIISEEFNIMALVPREKYPSDKDIIDKIMSYLNSLKEKLTLEEHCKIYNMEEYEVISYILMYNNNPLITEICKILLADNITRLIDVQTRSNEFTSIKTRLRIPV